MRQLSRAAVGLELLDLPALLPGVCARESRRGGLDPQVDPLIPIIRKCNLDHLIL